MKIALAGLGRAAAQAHLPSIGRLSAKGRATLVGAADPDARRRRETGPALPGVPIFADAEEMLATVDAEVLVVATDPGPHAELIELGLRNGVTVVCEKPLVVTRPGYERIVQAHARQPLKAIVSVHQYRYSRTWGGIARCARAAARLRVPFSLAVEVRRPTVDAGTVPGWRLDPDISGGMIADHAVHYLALGWTVDEHLDLLAGLRTWGGRGERSGVSCRLRGGVLKIQVSSGAPSRSTRIAFDAGRLAIHWRDERLEAMVGNRQVLGRDVAAISDRSYVDALYDRFYADLARNADRAAWGAHRTAETLVVGRALVELLERPILSRPRPARQ